MEEILSKTPPPSGNSNQASYISLQFFALQNTPHPWKFHGLLWGEYGYFLELHLSSLESHDEAFLNFGACYKLKDLNTFAYKRGCFFCLNDYNIIICFERGIFLK